MDYITQNIAERLGGPSFGKATTVYKFARIKALKDEAALKFKDSLPLIDMGVGEPDRPADPAVAEVLRRECSLPENRFYSDNGIAEFQDAAAEYMDKVFGVKGLTRKNIIHGIGTKPILAMLPLCFINPGDISLVTVPGYPVLGTYTKYCGGEVYNLPINSQNNFYPDLDNIPADILSRAKLLYINYPNNPTGQVATPEFFAKVVDFAKKNNIIVIHDAAYAALTYYGERPLSFLSTPGAMDIGAEIQSLSKGFNMTGWRLGFLAGNEKILAAYGNVKDNTDSGQFRAIQKAGVYALNHPEITEAICEKYARRMTLLADTLSSLGFKAKPARGSFYCYVEAPRGLKDGHIFSSAQEAAEYMILNANISVVPWDDSGAYLRFSVTYQAATPEDEISLMADVKSRIEKLGFVF